MYDSHLCNDETFTIVARKIVFALRIPGMPTDPEF